MDLSQWWPIISQLTSDPRLLVGLRLLVIVGLGFLLARLASLALRRLLREAADPHRAVLMQRGVYYLVLVLIGGSLLRELGFDLGVLLGAAGILTVAIGFASQTSMSNLISGLFLIGERPFALGDIIRVGNTVGEVLAIDLLSVKLRALDNTFVRIPNETILKAEVTTLTKFPIRRIDLPLSVAYKEDVAKVKQVLFDIADQNPLCLAEPQPLFIFQGFGESALNIQFSVWVTQKEFLTLKNNIQIEIKAAFEREGIEIPFPHRSLHTDSASEPFQVTIVSENSSDVIR